MSQCYQVILDCVLGCVLNALESELGLSLRPVPFDGLGADSKIKPYLFGRLARGYSLDDIQFTFPRFGSCGRDDNTSKAMSRIKTFSLATLRA